MATRAQLIATRFQRVIETILPAQGAPKTSTTFDLWRRNVNARNDLGITTANWQKAQSAAPCIFNGVPTDVHIRYSVPSVGSNTAKVAEIWTTVSDIRPGDNVYLALDTTYYLVQAINVEGGVTRCLLNSGMNTFSG